MRFIYACMFLTMSLVIIQLIRNLSFTKKCIELANKKIEMIKEIIDNYGKS